MADMEGGAAAAGQGADAEVDRAFNQHLSEHPELVAERLMRFAECIGRDNLMAGTDCGFSQSPLAGRVHRSIMWAKLRTLGEGAAIASKMAWG